MATKNEHPAGTIPLQLERPPLPVKEKETISHFNKTDRMQTTIGNGPAIGYGARFAVNALIPIARHMTPVPKLLQETATVAHINRKRRRIHIGDNPCNC